mgnify:CR=1 FL=1
MLVAIGFQSELVVFMLLEVVCDFLFVWGLQLVDFFVQYILYSTTSFVVFNLNVFDLKSMLLFDAVSFINASIVDVFEGRTFVWMLLFQNS